jgi:hypothetical protein
MWKGGGGDVVLYKPLGKRYGDGEEERKRI